MRPFLILAIATTLHAAQLPDFASLPEHPVSQPVIGRVAALPNYVHAASNGSEFFFVWSDLWSNPWGETSHNTPAAFGARVNENGQMLDAADVPLPFADNVFWSGSVWIVTSNRTPDAQFIHIAPDGTILDPVPRTIAKHGSIAAAAMDRLLLLQPQAPFTAAIFDLQGQPLTQDLYYFGNNGSRKGNQLAVWNGSAFVVGLSVSTSPYMWDPQLNIIVSAVDLHGNLLWQKIVESTRAVLAMDSDGAGTTVLALGNCQYMPCSFAWISLASAA